MDMYKTYLSDKKEHGIIEWGDNTINIEDTKDDLRRGESYEWVNLDIEEQKALLIYLQKKFNV